MKAQDQDRGLRTVNPLMQRILAACDTVATSRASVLILGESGTGKELLARYIHHKSQRRSRKMAAINCAAVPAGLLESELFGHEKGSFTGAHQRKLGKFELAHHSTLLLDEVSEMPLDLQAKLLRVLQEGEIERVGGQESLHVDVRIIATANRDLAQLVSDGKFREDLYYRLNVVPMQIPPLRERPDDVIHLVHLFTDLFSQRANRVKPQWSDAAIDKLLAWHWPGNVRELENVIERVVLFHAGQIIESQELPFKAAVDASLKAQVDRKSSSVVANPASELGIVPIKVGMSVAEAERELIRRTLEHTRFNRTKAAALLGLSVRTLRNKLHEYGWMNPSESEARHVGSL